MDDVFDVANLRIPLLIVENYFMCSRTVELVLRSKGVWRIVSGEKEKPENAEALLKFDTHKKVTFSCILLSVHESCMGSVMTIRDLADVWRPLKNNSELVSQASIDVLLERYQDMNMDASESVLDYVNRLAIIEMQLGGIGHTVTDAEKLRAVIRALTKDFEVTAEVIIQTGTCLKDAIPRLIAKEGQLLKHGKRSPHDSGNASALQAQTLKMAHAK
ncbi:hypothetical protein BWQ96_03384 [Gracilariopsis chorda]|uniref:Uncharacterized protein n=1 Tax=Gracilariopsis chorda TaxID=448386 RepID=A0A2V3IXR4_9FLOR|nr:hypothetical protein BWQ96_03384 [Gracilariopsis chorda]|eukprot:PXF46855.1 hypothetical protein BWQ96_03384 [Gracilariopsis chorda]